MKCGIYWFGKFRKITDTPLKFLKIAQIAQNYANS